MVMKTKKKRLTDIHTQIPSKITYNTYVNERTNTKKNYSFFVQRKVGHNLKLLFCKS